MPPIITAPAHRPHHPERAGLRARVIQTVTTAPGAVAVQIVYASRRGSRSTGHLSVLLAEWASAPGEYGLLEMGHPGDQAVQRQLAELMDDGGGRSVYMAAQQLQAKDRRGRFRDAQ